MWFRTRVGLVGVIEPVEIMAAQTTGAQGKYWYVFARLKAQQEGSIKALMGGGTFTNPVSSLAMFSDGPGVGRAVADCLALVERSIVAGSAVCDLSLAGDAAAWGEKWNQIEWPR